VVAHEKVEANGARLMLNIPALTIIETSAGQKMPVIMANLSGVSERTFRQTSLSDKTINKVEEGAKSNIRNKLAESEWPEQEIDEFIKNYPRSLYAGLIYGCQVPGKMNFAHTIEFASCFDDISSDLFKAREQNNLQEFKRILLTSEVLDRRYYVFVDDEWSSSADPEALSKIKSAQDWTDIDKSFSVLIFNVLFSLMAHWDIEFCQQYFYALEPKPLFSLVLPKLDPAAKYLDESTVAKRRGMFLIPVKRLIDFMACLGHHNRDKSRPDYVPKVSDIVRVINEREQELVNWRDGTKRFMFDDFRRIWKKLCPDVIVPDPMFIAATMWQTYLVEVGVNKKAKTMLLFDGLYQWWWEAHYSKLANDLSLSSEEKDRWPACFDAI
jgi:hypothetical protein